MARRRERFSERILEKAPRKGRKKVSKKKTPKVSLPEIINIPGIGEIELPKQKRKTKAKKADAKPDIGRPKKVKAGKKRPPKVRITEAKPKVREDIQIDIPEIINIPGVGQIEVPKAKSKPKPKAKAKPKAKPKPKPKAKAKVKARPKPKPRPVKLPDELIDENLREDIRITPGMLEGLIGGEKISAPTAPKPPVDTPKEKPIAAPPMTGGPVRTSDDTKGGIFGRLPDSSNLSELDKLKQRFDMLTSMRFVKDPGPEHYQKIKELGDQIYALDKNFKSDYYTPPAEPKPDVGREPTPDLPPAPTAPIRVDTTPEPAPPPPPQFIDMDPLKGMRETIIPRNILGQSFDPSVRDDYEKQMQAARAAMMQPGGNIRATEYPTYQTPTLAVPQTQFGGYGQPMPVAPLLPYAGLATATPPQEIPRPPASGARVNPGTGQIEPEGIAPPPRVTNLPPGVTGPIR